MRLPLTAIVTCAVLAFAGGASAADDPYAALLAPSGTCGAADAQLNLSTAAARRVMTCLTNYARTHAGLRPLQLSAVLNNAGTAKLNADVSCGEFSHTPCGKPFVSMFNAYLRGATSYMLGENIAWGTGSLGTPRQIMREWLHSKEHRENILRGSFTEIGIGYLGDQEFQGFAGGSLWSQEFGTRAPARMSSATVSRTSTPAAKTHRVRTRALDVHNR
jgi:uncharacterized protein YkwD